MGVTSPHTVSHEGPAGQHPGQHALEHGEDEAAQAAHYGHAEEEVVLRQQERGTKDMVRGRGTDTGTDRQTDRQTDCNSRKGLQN